MIFLKALFLCFLAPFLNQLTKNFEIGLDLKKIRCRLRISQRKGQNSIPKPSYLSLKMLQYLCPRQYFGKVVANFFFKQCSLKKFLIIWILQRKYMEMCFHSNKHPWAIKHPFISLYFRYHSPGFICFSTMLASSLDKIYCTTSFKNIN